MIGMKIKFLTITILILSVSIMLIGCGEKELLSPANVIETIPSDGGSIDANGIVTIKFDNSPVEGTVKVNSTPAEGGGTRYNWRPVVVLKEGDQVFEITWKNEDGSMGENTITLHVMPSDLIPPKIVSSSPEDGDKDVDPEKLREDGIVITFDENIDTRMIKIYILIGEEKLSWLAKWSADKKILTLEYKGGMDLPYESEVKLVIQNAVDDAGNTADMEIIFFTQASACDHFHIDPRNIVGMWPFDEGKGVIVKDIWGNNDGEIKGNAKWVKGKFGKGIAFDGLNATVEVRNSPTLNITQSITITAWIMPIQSKGLIVGKEDAYGMALEEEGIKWVIWGDEFVAKVKITVQEWHHLALVYDFDAKKRFVYFNGKLIAEKETSVTIPVSNQPLSIGKWATLGEAFNGSIDEVIIWNVALTEAQIKREYMILF